MLCRKFAQGLQSYEAKSFKTTLITPLCLGKKVRILIKNCSRNIIFRRYGTILGITIISTITIIVQKIPTEGKASLNNTKKLFRGEKFCPLFSKTQKINSFIIISVMIWEYFPKANPFWKFLGLSRTYVFA